MLRRMHGLYLSWWAGVGAATCSCQLEARSARTSRSEGAGDTASRPQPNFKTDGRTCSLASLRLARCRLDGTRPPPRSRRAAG